MSRAIEIAGKLVGEGHPVFVLAEIGINHNGDLNIARRLIDAAVKSGCDAVKFQKRTPDLCVPVEQRDQMRETPWGYVSYIDYRHRIEFGEAEYREIDKYCRERGMAWFASCWDEPSVDFMETFNPPCHKVPSAALTDHGLLRHMHSTGRPVILSTGMSTTQQIQEAVAVLGTDNLIILHCTSSYPVKAEELNLRVIQSLREQFDCPIGYSGHEVGLPTSYAAVALGAVLLERHITLDRAMWGTDQAPSIEPGGLQRLVRDVRVIESGFGDGIKKVYDSEIPVMQKLRRI